MTNLARLLSLVLGPVFLWPLTLLIILLKTNLSTGRLMFLFPVLFLLLAIIPLTYVLLAFKHKKISDLDLFKKDERYGPLLITLVCLLLSLSFVYFFGNRTLTSIFILLTLLILINGFITLFWKISFHVGLNTISALLINYLFHWTLPILYLIIPLVFWSRLKLKKHTIYQLIAALILNGIIVLLFIKYVLAS